jgi:hypothetical protein
LARSDPAPAHQVTPLKIGAGGVCLREGVEISIEISVSLGGAVQRAAEVFF